MRQYLVRHPLKSKAYRSQAQFTGGELFLRESPDGGHRLEERKSTRMATVLLVDNSWGVKMAMLPKS